jgi:peptidoglycan/LPS O-acetylase OafA/YrhL
VNRQLGAFGGVAMVIIVLVHAFDNGTGAIRELGYSVTPWMTVSLKTVHLFGAYTVPIFLFVSGSFMVYASRARSDGSLSWHFLSRSLLRILVPYFLWALLFYLLVSVQNGQQYTLFEYLKHLLVGYPFHFVPLLVFFYLVSPWLLRWAASRPIILLLLVGVLQLFFMNLGNPATLGISLPEWMHAFAPPVLSRTFAQWGIYFPLGLVFSLHAATLKPVLIRLRYVITIVALALFIVGALHIFSIVRIALIELLAPFAFMFVIPVINRKAIPQVRFFERVGRHAYGIYLSHLIFQTLLLLAVEAFTPGLFAHPVFIFLLLFAGGLAFPLLLMSRMEAARTRVVYRYVFG